jgi:hypothetical protein
MVGAACDRAPVCAKPCQNNAPCVVTNYATGAARREPRRVQRCEPTLSKLLNQW